MQAQSQTPPDGTGQAEYNPIEWALTFGTVYAGFADAANHFPDQPVFEVLPETAAAYGIHAGSMSYRQLSERIWHLSESYYACGLQHGDRVGLLFENRPVFLEHWLALNQLGVSIVPISAEMRMAELTYLIGHSEIRMALALESHQGLLREAAGRAGRQVPVIGIGDPLPQLGQGHAGSIGRPSMPGLDTECALLYTSGTTGQPKGCVLSNEYFLFAGGWYLGLGGLCTVGEGCERLITPLPLNHMNALACSTMAMLLSGGCIIQLDRFHPATWWQSVRQSRATIVHYLGVMPSMLMTDAAQASDRDHQVRFGFGAGVDKRLHAPFEERFGFPLIEAWAMTETGVGACVIAHQEPRHIGKACFGKPDPRVQVRLVDDEGQDVAVGTPGQMLVRAAGENPARGFFRHYLKDEAATAEAWQGGWFHTGDVVQADEQGYLYFIDRKKNVIRRSGENIAAVEVETVLRRHPAVREVAVAATPDPVRGDEVLACVVLKDDWLQGGPEGLPAAALAEVLTRHCLSELAYFKAPGWVAFVKALPLTLTNKIQRGQMKQIAAALPGQPDCFDTRALKKREAL